MMTVKELIEILEQYPGDTPVVNGYNSVENVYLDNDYYFADSKNPNQAFGPAVVIE